MSQPVPTRPILLACPHYGRHVRGTYLCDAAGQYLLTAQGTLALEMTRCGQAEGRCAQTLCALHRYNRRGPNTWFPEIVRVNR